MKDTKIIKESVEDRILLAEEIKIYTAPKLTCFGDVRDVTLGGSIPGVESLGGCIIGIDLGCNP